MGNARGVGGGHSVGNLDGDVEQFARRQRSAFEQGGERLTGHELRDDVGNAIFVADVVKAQNIGVIDAATARASCSKRERRLRSAETLAGQNLDGHIPSQARIAGAVHFAHGAGA